MPHAGGGGHFHGGGHSHSSGFHSHHIATGNHSSYRNYRRPGFYYRGRYVHYYSYGRRGLGCYVSAIFLFIIGFLFTCFSLTAIFSRGKYDENKLADYGLQQYSEIYNPDSQNYENNVLLVFVSYQDGEQYCW